MAEDFEAKFRRQIDRERQSEVDGHKKYLASIGLDADAKEHRPMNSNPLLIMAERKAIAAHIAVFAEAIAAEFPEDSVRFNKLHRSWPPELKASVRELFSKVSPPEAAFTILKYAIKNMFVNEQKYNYASVCEPAAEEVIAQYNFRIFQEMRPGYVAVLLQDQKTRHEGHRHSVLTAARRSKGVPDFDMEKKGKIILGGTLLHLLVASTGLFEFADLFDHSKGLRTMVLVASERFMDWLEEQHDEYADLQPVDVPMIVPPKAWSDTYDGGFLTNLNEHRRHSIIRQKQKDLRSTGFKRTSKECLAGLEALQNVPWSINMSILDILTQVSAVQSGLGGVPLRPMPRRSDPKPWDGLGMTAEQFKKSDPEAFRQWRNRRSAEYDRYYHEASARTTFITQLSVAREFAKEERFYFCYNMDWRGRVYALQNCGLNPQGDDFSKALLQFADAKPLGERGVFWLGVHVANSFGVDKVSFDERYAWTIEHHAEIMATAADPFEHKWWTEADKPYCFLAGCLEWAAANSMANPTLYESKLPISMDASCSGSQHFSGLLRDPIGGKAVNLLPADKPSDIYALVAAKSIAIMQAEGKPEGAAWLSIEGGFNRTWTKRNTMTMPYSAGLYGFTNQLLEEIRKFAKKHEKNLLPAPEGVRQATWDFNCARYLAEVNRRAISQVVVKMFEAMEWFREMAAVVAKAGRDIEWVTPVGLRVVQRYRKSTSKQLHLWFGGIRYNPHILSESTNPNTEGHKNGISPNFIHSMDGSHLIKVALGFKGALGVVHDSFSTHACDVEAMRDVIRREFVGLYGDSNILQAFYQRLQSANPDLELDPPPEQGEMDVSLVEQSAYFIS